MLGLHVEHRRLVDSGQLAAAIAQDMYSQGRTNSIAIIAKRPRSCMAALKREWQNLSDDPTPRITTTPPIHDPQADVLIATIHQFLRWPPDCRTLYVTCPIGRVQLVLVTTWMPTNSRVIIYGSPDQDIPIRTRNLHEITDR